MMLNRTPVPRRYRKSNDTAVVMAGIGFVLCGVALALSCAAAWVTHVIVCIKTASWILLLFGCVVAPIGIIHGVGVWFGVF